MKIISWFSEKLVRRLVGPSLFLAVLAVCLLSVITYYSARNILAKSVSSQLQVAVDLHENELNRWVDDQKTTVIFISRAAVVRGWVADLLIWDKADPYYKEAYRKLAEYLFSYIKNFPGLREIMVLSNRGGQVVFSTITETENEFRARDSFFLQGRKDLFVQGVYPWHDTAEPTITIAKPLLDGLGQKAGVLAVHLDLERLDKVISGHKELGRTGEIYLVDKFNTFINADRFGRDDFPRGVHTEGIDLAVAGGEGVGYYLNYSGIPVVGYYRWLPELQVAILAEIHQLEAFYPAQKLGFSIAGFGLLATLLLVVGNIFFARKIAVPLETLSSMAQKVADGDFAIRVPVIGNDETGVLAESFNRMVHHLQIAYSELENSTERLQLLINRMPIGCITWNNDFTVNFWNPEAEKIFGFTAEEATGQHAYDLIVPTEVQSLVTPVWQHLLDGDETAHSENDNVTRSGDVIICDWYNTPLKNESGETVGVISMVMDITDKKEAEDSLRLQKELLQTILNAIPAPIFFKDLDGIYQGCNKAFCDYLGFAHKQIIGHTVYDLAPADKAKIYEDADRKLLEQGGIQIYEAKVRFADGSDRDAVFHKAVYHNPNGTVGGLVGNMLDVTEIRQAEAELAEGTQNYREIFNASSEAILIRDMESGEVVDVNQAMLDMYGYGIDEALLLAIDDLSSGNQPYTIEQAYKYIARAKAGKSQLFEWHAKKRDGTLFWAEIALKQAVIRGETRMLSVVRDISERKEAERAHRESEERFHLLIEHAADALFLHNEEGCILTVNQRACDSLGYSRDELIGMTISQLDTHLNIDQQKTFWASLTIGKAASIEGSHLRKDGTSFPVDVNVVKFEFQSACFYLALARDISERKITEAELERYRNRLEELVMERTKQLEAAQEELVQKERLAVLGQLTATVSHELRNPLGTVKNAIYLLGKVHDGEFSEKFKKTLDLANRNVTRCDGIINELLDFTRQQELSPVQIDIGKWLETIIDEQRLPEDVKITRSWKKGIMASCDPERMRRAVINIITNAIQTLQEVDSRKRLLKIKVEPVTDRLNIIFSDNGPGIDDVIIERIFEPMFSTKNFGVGLGMPIVKNIMQEHDGGIELESRLGKGTTVTLWLPL